MKTVVAIVTALAALVVARCALSTPPRPELLGRLIEEDRLEEARRILDEDQRLAAGVRGRLLPAVLTSGGAGQDLGRAGVLVLLVDFSDLPADTILHNRPWFDRVLFDSANQASMRSYYLANSYGGLDITGDVRGWFRVAEPITYYANGRRGMGPYPNSAQRLVEDAIDAADASVDFSVFDNDGPDGVPASGDDDGVVDFLLVIHAGQGYEWTMNADDIHSHAGAIRGKVADGVTVREYAIEPEEGKVGTFAHEMGHLLGLPDLYDASLSSFGLGMWSLMAYGSWGGGDGSRPVGLDAWSKSALGFVDPVVVEENLAGFELACVEDLPRVIRLWSEGEEGPQYFLVENRRAKAYDSHLASVGEGLLVYHVDERYRDNSSEARHLVRLEQADGRFDLDRQRYFGFGSDGGDPFPGSTGNRAFSWATTPDNRSNEGAPTEVCLSNIGNPGDVVTLDAKVRTPVIVFESVVVDDAAGDGDGELDPGEEAILRVRLENHGIACGGVTVSLATGDPYVSLVTATVQAGTVAGHALSPYLGFKLRALAGIPQPHNVALDVSISGTSETGPYASSDHFVLAVPLRRLAGWPCRAADVIFSPPAVADLDGDQIKEIIFGDYAGLVYARRADGSLVDGWPVAIGGRTTSKPAICDVDIDGRPDVVVASQDGKVYVFRADGTALPGWPRATGGTVIASVALGDIDDDGVVEVICGSKDGKVYAWNEDGSAVGGWPVALDGNAIWMSPAVADCDGDYVPEVVVGGYGGSLYALEGDGGVMPGWPTRFGWGCGSGSPAIGDFDGDGAPEIIVSGLFSNSIYLVGTDGRVKPGWPRWAYNCASLSAPIAADIDGDGLPEVAVATSCGTMVAWKANGDKCDVISAATSETIEYCEPLFVDLDGNGDVECILGTAAGATSHLYAFGREGAVVGFPIEVAGSIWATPTVADLEGDGYAEIVVVTTAGNAYAWRFVGARTAGRSEWSQSRGDIWNTALYGLRRQDNIPLADLAVASAGIAFDPAKPRQGEEMAISVRILNIGHAAAGSFTVSAHYDEAGQARLIGSTPVAGLAAKRDTTVALSWVVPGGAATRLVSVELDASDAVLERSELNNRLGQRFYLSVADLEVSIVGVDPFPADVGDTVLLKGRLGNVGADVGRDFQVCFYDSLVGGPAGFAAIQVDSVAPGEIIDLEARYLVEGFPDDFITLWCSADPDGEVLEYYLSNNTARYQLSSGIAGDLVVPSLEVPPRNFRCSRTGVAIEPSTCSCVLVAEAGEPFGALFEAGGSAPDICRNTVVFSSEGDIAGFDLEDGMQFLVSATAYEETQPAVWGDNIVWVAGGPERSYLMLKQGAGQPEAIAVADPGGIATPDVSSDFAVWSELDPAHNGWNIRAYDLAGRSAVSVCEDPGDQINPCAWGGVVAWEDRSRDGGDIEAFDLASAQAVAVARRDGVQQAPDVAGDLVVWQDSRNGNWDIYAYSLAEGREYPVSRQVDAQTAPCVTDSTVYWIDRRGHASRVMGLRIGGHRAVAEIRKFEALSQDALIRVAMNIHERDDAVTYKVYRYSDYKWDPDELNPSVRENFELGGDSVYVYQDSLLVERRSYFYKLGVIDGYGEETIYGPVRGQAYRRSATGFAVGSPFPNPFFHQVDIVLGLPRRVERADDASWPDPAAETSGVEVKIYSVSGQMVRTLTTAVLSPGYYKLTWDGRNDRGVRAGAGVYYLTVSAPGWFASRKVILLR